MYVHFQRGVGGKTGIKHIFNPNSVLNHPFFSRLTASTIGNTNSPMEIMSMVGFMQHKEHLDTEKSSEKKKVP